MVSSSMLSIDEQLNSVLIELNRSLLQYAYECWPYAQAGDSAAAKLTELAAIQQTDVGVLVDVLLERQWPIDFGTYPTEYTALQYNSVPSIAGALHKSQQIAFAKLEEVIAACAEDAFVSEVLSQVRTNENAVLAELKNIAAA